MGIADEILGKASPRETGGARGHNASDGSVKAVCHAANDIDPCEVLSWLGVELDGKRIVRCPGCGASTGVDVLDHGWKCQHSSCKGKGSTLKPGFRSNIDTVIELKGEDIRGAVNLLAERFGTPAFPPKQARASDTHVRVQGPVLFFLTEKGNPKTILANVLNALSASEAWRGVLAYDAFSERVVTTCPPPVRPTETPADHQAGAWTDEDDARTCAWLSAEYGLHVPTVLVRTAVLTLARGHVVHPVRDYLEGLTWDRTHRVTTALAAYWGAKQTAYTEAVATVFLVGAVARVYRPGCKLDTIPVFQGPQGTYKSTALRVLFDPWFSDTGITIGDKDSYQVLRGVWGYEFAEFQSVKSARDQDRVKNFISSGTDHYRPSYGHHVQDVPRQTIFAGTVNDETYLADRTGNRRFLPVTCGAINVEALRRDKPLLWAEAVDMYRRGVAWHVTDQRVAELAAAEQRDREVPDDWVPIVARWLESPTLPTGNYVEGKPEQTRLQHVDEEGVTTEQALLGAIEMHKADIKQAATIRMGFVLRECGWHPVPNAVRRDGRRVRIYRPGVTQSAQSPNEDCAGDTVSDDPAENMPESARDTVCTVCTRARTRDDAEGGISQSPVGEVRRMDFTDPSVPDCVCVSHGDGPRRPNEPPPGAVLFHGEPDDDVERQAIESEGGK